MKYNREDLENLREEDADARSLLDLCLMLFTKLDLLKAENQRLKEENARQSLFQRSSYLSGKM